MKNQRSSLSRNNQQLKPHIVGYKS